MLRKEEELVCALIGIMDVLWQGKFPPSEQTMASLGRRLAECGYKVPKGWPK